MKPKIMNIMMFIFIVFSSLTIASMFVDFTPQLTRSFGVNALYAQNDDDQGEDNDDQNGNYSVPEPSTLLLLGTGLAAGGGIYGIIKYRRRNKKS